MEGAATTIQTRYRGMSGRKKRAAIDAERQAAREKIVMELSSTKIQASFRGRKGRRQAAEERRRGGGKGGGKRGQQVHEWGLPPPAHRPAPRKPPVRTTLTDSTRGFRAFLAGLRPCANSIPLRSSSGLCEARSVTEESAALKIFPTMGLVSPATTRAS